MLLLFGHGVSNLGTVFRKACYILTRWINQTLLLTIVPFARAISWTSAWIAKPIKVQRAKTVRTTE